MLRRKCEPLLKLFLFVTSMSWMPAFAEELRPWEYELRRVSTLVAAIVLEDIRPELLRKPSCTFTNSW